jgi:DNA-binding LytR/AlgR family response regulator
MKQVTCIIVDDEPGAQRILEEYISNTQDLKLKGSFFNALDAFHFLRMQSVDFILLDINMPEISGFALIKMLESPPLIVITSAYSEYAIEGFDYNVLDYLLKPIRYERFSLAIERVKNSIEPAKSIPAKITFLDINYKGENKNINLDDIQYIESVGNYIKIVTSIKRYVIHNTTKEIEVKLKGTDFIRIHKSYIVNKKFIKEIKNNSIVVSGQILPVGKTFKKYFEMIIGKNQT